MAAENALFNRTIIRPMMERLDQLQPPSAVRAPQNFERFSKHGVY